MDRRLVPHLRLRVAVSRFVVFDDAVDAGRFALMGLRWTRRDDRAEPWAFRVDVRANLSCWGTRRMICLGTIAGCLDRAERVEAACEFEACHRYPHMLELEIVALPDINP